jgi:hypothetical protein
MNNYFREDPYPSGWTGPSLWDRIWENILNAVPESVREFLWNGYQSILDFWAEYTAWILLTLVLIAIGILVFNVVRRREKNIQKLWSFVLFFLSKRQMTIPLIYTLAQRDGILDTKILDDLLRIRNECRGLSLRRQPTQRLQQEKKVSRILYDYFSTLERQGKIQSNSKFKQLVQDMEFIDQKLIQLQKTYNDEVILWNRKYDTFPIKILGIMFGFRRFEPFKDA